MAWVTVGIYDVNALILGTSFTELGAEINKSFQSSTSSSTSSSSISLVLPVLPARSNLLQVEMPPRNRHRYQPVIADAMEDGEGVSCFS